jgi:purine-nucleoside phosphorylase
VSQASAFEQLRDWKAATAIVLGSGLNLLVRQEAHERAIAYGDFSELSPPTVPGHAGRFVLDEIADRRIILAQGRLHLYEGRSAREVTAGIRLLASAGVRRIILTNAAGSANAAFPPGSWMMITDHLNLTGTTPLLGEPGFIDMSEVYSTSWRLRFAEAANKLDVVLYEGVYAGLLGPQYETPAEVRMLQKLGADAIGMSTVLEAIQARALGLEVAGFSCLTNWAAGLGSAPLSHAEVLRTGEQTADQFARLLSAALL